jgi:hypothetical protein
VSYPRLQWTQFDDGAKDWKVRGPTKIDILKLIDGLEAVRKIEALLSTSDTLLTLTADLVREIWVEKDNRSISSSINHLRKRAYDGRLQAYHILRA